ncbi:hypothetical protein I8D64_11680 [Brachybacterium sp. MASK1Z-5]|uniref:Uncharacterized protein n=1 Tax=Brachybacterium halotolerans TaxID=2795215 RepID=A0ABS1BBL4_9MICO|nr:hypothetical protein [Brachybacterium halotolerans]MBK0332059.1 hypothetical protein [Brachybacterium halotolerans]
MDDNAQTDDADNDELTDDELAVLADPSVWIAAERAARGGGSHPRRRLPGQGPGQ